MCVPRTSYAALRKLHARSAFGPLLPSLESATLDVFRIRRDIPKAAVSAAARPVPWGRRKALVGSVESPINPGRALGA